MSPNPLSPNPPSETSDTPTSVDDEASASPSTGAVTSRRMLLGGAGVFLGGAVAGALVKGATDSSTEPVAEQTPRAVPFYGTHQPGVTTAAQDRLMFAALDVSTSDKTELMHLLGTWSAMAARFQEGEQVAERDDNPDVPPKDTGETMDMPAENLTITVGFGASLFDDRFGLAGRMPAALQSFEPLPGSSTMTPEISDGDLCIQACADDPQVVFHAVRNMVRAARGVAVLRWSQLGFGRASATGAGQSTPRNLFGFKDGTRNIHADDQQAVDDYVWVGDEGDQPWMIGGTYLVARKIRMEIEAWDADFLADQERIFARFKSNGAPLTGKDEFDTPDFAAIHADAPVIDPDSHVALAAPENNGGIRILRRGYNYTDGQHPGNGKLDAGLFFISFQKDPHKQFVPLQTKLGKSDLMNEYVAHIGGGTWACPPGVSKAGDWFGKQLFS